MIIENFDHISPKDFAHDVIQRLDQRYGLSLGDIVRNHALSTRKKRQLMVTNLLEAVWAELDAHNANAGIEYVPTPHDEALMSSLLKDTDIELEPNVILTEHNARVIRGYQGDDVYNYLFTLTKRFENMANGKTAGQLAIEVVAGGLVAVGVPMAVAAIKAWRAGAVLLAAVKTGITSIGMKTVIGAVVVILVALLLFLLLDNPKKILGMVINDTDEQFVVDDWRKGLENGRGMLHMEHGHMASFPEDHESEDLDSPKVQLRKRFYFGPGDESNSVCAGIYFADRNFGLRGAEGVMVFTSKSSSAAIAHMFAVPYINDNGTNMRVLPSKPDPSTLSALFRELYNGRKVRVDFTDKGYRLTSTVNHARGGVVGLIGCIEKV